MTIEGSDILKHKRNGGIDVVKKLQWIVSVKGRLEAMQKTLKVIFHFLYQNCSFSLHKDDS